MIRKWLSWLNFSLLGLSLALGLAGGMLWSNRPAEIICNDPIQKKCGLPKGAFEFHEHAYQTLGDSLLALEKEPPTVQVPDLRQQLVYYGKNGRPDAQTKQTLMHFSLNANKNVITTPPNEKLYLIYDRKSTPPRYNFSPNNEISSLWIIPSLADNEARIQVVLENDKGEEISEPKTFANFNLSEKEFIRYGGVANNWEIGPHRVDGTLLARQKARWFGPDRFLTDQGGEEYEHCHEKHRIDFGDNDEIYSVFVNCGECLIWDSKQWKVIEPSEESLRHPLLHVKKIDERIITFELWDVEGKGKVILNLLKSSDPWSPQNIHNLQNMFKFVGSRTKSQSTFEINRERVVLKPFDWLLLTPKGWKKLATLEEIDNYVKRKTTGMLFVFEGIVRKDEKQMMRGTIYSPSRTESHAVEVALISGHSKSTSKDNKHVEQHKEKIPSVNKENETAAVLNKLPNSNGTTK